MVYSKENWYVLLNSLGFKEESNTSFGGKVLYDDEDIPRWTYDENDAQYKEHLFQFLNGALWMKWHIK